MTTEDQITFRLAYLCRFDEQVKSYVGYIPRLQLFAQSPTEAGLKHATKAVALRFLMACVDRGTLADVMRECSMRKAPDHEIEGLIDDPEREYVRYHYDQCEPIEVTINMDSLVGVATA